MGLFDKFKIGLGKSSDGLSTGFKNIFSKVFLDLEVSKKNFCEKELFPFVDSKAWKF